MATTTFYTKQRCNWIEGRDAKVDEVMREWMHKFCSFQDVKICVSTFNVNGKSPLSSFSGWFSQKREDIAEFYAVGLQEMDLSVGTYIIDNTKKMEGWVDAIHNSLPGGRTHYNVVGSMRLVGIFVIVFQATHSQVRVSDVNVKYVATGISVLVNKLGNKGGTAISMKMNDTWVCFVNAHFAAGNNELERRNQDFRDIYNDVVFYPRSQQEGYRDRPLEVPVMCLYDHDVVFWFGDLNYRLNTDLYGISNDDVRRIASSDKFGDLLQYCQLREQMARGTVFKDFEEPATLPFRPTYKYDCGTSIWDTSEKGRVPAWTDRILTFKKYPQVGLELIRPMESVEAITISDHKPVRALFNLKVKKINESGANSVYEEAIREADRRANEELPQVQLSSNEVDFGIVNYLEPKTRSVIVQNVGKSKVRFSFKVRPNAQNNQEICEKWLMVTPTHYQIPQGSSMEINLTVSISTDIVRRIQDILRNGQLQEILVLHLENGRDYFIPVTAIYNNSCFGSTLEKLLTIRPKKEVNLIDFEDFADNLPSDDCPQDIPRVIYRLVSALRVRGAKQLNIVEELDNEVFNRIRSALETGQPDDLSQLASSYMLYSALIRLLDSLDEPIIMEGMFKIIHKEMIKYRNDARQLWTTVRSSLPKPNQAVLELLCLMLREFFSQNYELRGQLSLWATVLFRHDSMDEKTHGMYPTVLQTMCDYAPDVSLG
ncbi:CBN-OCRL-1 protein [Caenorhabditis brenneri]|uniref:CBN-OCRL-1 protein n=1 Tax=Caenorhabditis brenneri TaxID=135651 RepID=G0P7R8_CAEBE|nr:CBN-OCRL-1 protein [Caenorhabditis brenneri]